MTKGNILPVVLGLASLCLSTPLMANTFDDAVNLYLKGFDHCTAAKDALTSGNLRSASVALKKYETLKAQAVGINNTILSSSKRGMDSNLKYCERVATDIEIEVGTPILDRAIEACDKAAANLKANNPDQAKLDYDQFIALKTEALGTAPRLNELFSARSQINRCERLQKKITNFSQKQEALSLAIETVVEESEAYSSLCDSALKNLSGAPLDNTSLQQARSAQASARSRHQAVMTETVALAELEKTPASPEKISVDKHLASGDRCMDSLNSSITAKASELKLAQQELSEYASALNKAKGQCQNVQKSTISSATRQTYDSAKSQYESAIKTRNDVNAALSKNAYYNNSDWGSVNNIEKTISALNACLDKSRTHLGALFSALPASAPAVASVAQKIESGALTAGVPAQKISGSINMLNTAPEYAIVYMEDGTKPADNQEITIYTTGFDKQVYFVGSGDTFRFKSKDFTTHRITASNESLNFSSSLTQIRSRQSREAKVTWPANSLVEIRSDRGAITPAHIANVTSSNYQIIMFDFGANTVSFELDNPNEAATGYLLLPDFDPLVININQGEIKSLAITHNKEPLGSVLLKGL